MIYLVDKYIDEYLKDNKKNRLILSICGLVIGVSAFIKQSTFASIIIVSFIFFLIYLIITKDNVFMCLKYILLGIFVPIILVFLYCYLNDCADEMLYCYFNSVDGKGSIIDILLSPLFFIKSYFAYFVPIIITCTIFFLLNRFDKYKKIYILFCLAVIFILLLYYLDSVIDLSVIEVLVSIIIFSLFTVICLFLNEAKEEIFIISLILFSYALCYFECFDVLQILASIYVKNETIIPIIYKLIFVITFIYIVFKTREKTYFSITNSIIEKDIFIYYGSLIMFYTCFMTCGKSFPPYRCLVFPLSILLASVYKKINLKKIQQVLYAL